MLQFIWWREADSEEESLIMWLLSSRSLILTCVHVFFINVGMLSALCVMCQSLDVLYCPGIFDYTNLGMVSFTVCLPPLSSGLIVFISPPFSGEPSRRGCCQASQKACSVFVFESLEREASTEFSSSPCFPRWRSTSSGMWSSRAPPTWRSTPLVSAPTLPSTPYVQTSAASYMCTLLPRLL